MLKQIIESLARQEKSNTTFTASQANLEKAQANLGTDIRDLHNRVDGRYDDLNNKFYHISSSFKALENQFVSMSSNSKRSTGSLPGKSEQNPKETMHLITLRSGRELPPRVLIKDNEKQDGEVVINIDDDVVVIDEKKNHEILEKIVEAKGKGKVEEVKKDSDKKQDATSSKEKSFTPPPYDNISRKGQKTIDWEVQSSFR